MNTHVTLFQATEYNALWYRELQRFVSRGDLFPLNLIVNYVYNLDLTRRGLTIN
jgi:hypothetical protein